MMPCVSFAKVAISDSDLDNVTAATGVTITFVDYVTVNTSLSSFSIGDADGCTGYGSAGFAGLTGVTVGTNETTTTMPFIYINGDMIVDVGRNTTTGPAVKITLPSIALDGYLANITGNLVTSTAKDLSGSSYYTKINMCDMSLHISGSVTVSPH